MTIGLILFSFLLLLLLVASVVAAAVAVASVAAAIFALPPFFSWPEKTACELPLPLEQSRKLLNNKHI